MTHDEIVEAARAALKDYEDAMRDHRKDPNDATKAGRRRARWEEFSRMYALLSKTEAGT